MARSRATAQAARMRTHLYALALCGVFACSDDAPRDKYDLTQRPSTGLDAGDWSELPPRSDGGRLNVIGYEGFGREEPTAPHDAGSLLDASDSSAGDQDASDGGAPYACRTENDCAIRDVGSCCGYDPRCANVNAIFTRPVCNGMAGVCGFAVIDSCACEQGTCVSLQAGVPVNP